MHVQVSLLVHLKNCIVHYDYTLWQIVYYNFVSIYNIVHYIYLLKFHEWLMIWYMQAEAVYLPKSFLKHVRKVSEI